MQFISVNVSLNQVYHIEKEVFEKITKKAIQKVKGVKFVSSVIELSKKNDDISIEVEVDKDKGISLKDTFSKIIEEIEILVFNLLDAKPKNIKIKLKG